MKRFFALMLIFCLIPLPCLANSWGLKGDLLEAVMAVDTWNDYSTLSSQKDNIAVMGSRYHNALMLMDHGELAVYSTAVYQPEDSRARKVSLSGDNDMFTLSYSDAESYTFMDNGSRYVLLRADIGDFSIVLDSSVPCYYASQNGQTLTVQPDFPLSGFNINLFPRSLEEVRHLNLMNAALATPIHFFDCNHTGKPVGLYLDGPGEGTVPVFSSPYGDSAWRAAKGKAAVSLKGGLWGHGVINDSDGFPYLLIHYDVSERTQRYGYIRADSIPGAEDFLPHIYPMQMPLRATRSTYLTDDPAVSQFPQFEVPEGTLFSCLSLYNQDYAYVSAEVRDGEIASGGQIVWGFVPLRDLKLFAEPVSDLSAMPFIGRFLFHSGSETLHGAVVLNNDGTYFCDDEFRTEGQLMTSSRGTWALYKNNPDHAVFAHEYSHVIAFTCDNGEVFVRGLRFEDNTLTLGGSEGFGCYLMDVPAYSPKE